MLRCAYESNALVPANLQGPRQGRLLGAVADGAPARRAPSGAL